ncbi:MAG: PIN domain-containing protein [Alphaproteobacteria bacterium]|nr:PIN domain-containing protein [Alphaproteobacteria bacterium]
MGTTGAPARRNPRHPSDGQCGTAARNAGLALVDGAVIDASVAVKWTLDEPNSDEALLLARHVPLAAPGLLLVECANVLWIKSRRSEITVDQAQERYEQLASAPIDYLEDRDLLPAALSLSGRLDHPVYDCLYVAASVALQAPLVTADGRLRRKLLETGPAEFPCLLLSEFAL